MTLSKALFTAPQQDGDDVLEIIRDIYRARQLARSISQTSVGNVWRRTQNVGQAVDTCPYPAVSVAGA